MLCEIAGQNSSLEKSVGCCEHVVDDEVSVNSQWTMDTMTILWDTGTAVEVAVE